MTSARPRVLDKQYSRKKNNNFGRERKSRNNKRERNTVGERDRLTRIICAIVMTSAFNASL